MACFADISVSQGSVATYARCGGIFDIHLTANLLGNLPVKKNCKSVKIWQNYGHESVAPFLAHAVVTLKQFTSMQSFYIVQSLRGSPCEKNVREVSLHFHELDHVA